MIADFVHEHRGCEIVYGRGAVGRLGHLLAARGLERALVVCGARVGANDAVIEPVRRGLGGRLVGVFDGTTPEKSAEAVFAGIERMRRGGADVLVGLGGGSSLDVARQISVFAADGRSLGELRDAARRGPLDRPVDRGATEVVVIPTTLAGADLSAGGSVEVLPAHDSPTGDPVRVGGSAMPTAAVYDPDLFETTPAGPLLGSAMNGLDKGIETLYARDASPVSDAPAIHGVRLLRSALPRLDDAGAMEAAVAGVLLVQLQRKIGIVHAFGHGLSHRYDVQQGLAHAVLVPHVLSYLLGKVDGRRDLLAVALGVDPAPPTPEALAEAIVGSVAGLRDALGLPDRLRDLGPVAEADLPAIAAYVRDDPPTARGPEGLEPTVDELEGVLRAAW
ncbi:MAG TPA: iron-containing alcohol dehydrogenase family protein [Longimicrobiales bacterium]|nr:iron-containing alcohol dehydrogenase family protein [Longimicrobiales bacterium]